MMVGLGLSLSLAVENKIAKGVIIGITVIIAATFVFYNCRDLFAAIW